LFRTSASIFLSARAEIACENNVAEISRRVLGFVDLTLVNDICHTTKYRRGSPENCVFDAFTAAVEKGLEPGSKGSHVLRSEILNRVNDCW